MRIILFITAISTMFIFNSCRNNDPSTEAEILSYDQLLSTPGFSWFPVERDLYQTNDSLVAEIVNNYNTNEHSFLMFVNPSCSCDGTQKTFPHLAKIMEDANVDFDKVQIYSMGNEDFSHDWDDQITLNDLPTFIVLKNGEPVYSILDSLDAMQAESVDRIILETPVLESLKK